MKAKFMSIKWHTDDVKDQAMRSGYKLTTKQANDILEEVINGHDCTLGISWDTFSFVIDHYIHKNNIKRIGEVK